MEKSPNDMARLHIWVTGRVQGVGFRAFVLQAGSLFGLTGWVRNVGYDQVETVAEGSREVLERFMQAVKPGRAPVAWMRPAWNGKHPAGNSTGSM